MLCTCMVLTDASWGTCWEDQEKPAPSPNESDYQQRYLGMEENKEKKEKEEEEEEESEEEERAHELFCILHNLSGLRHNWVQCVIK